MDGCAGQMHDPGLCDVLVIGGGINGAGIAADAAGRGLSVTLVEKGDLASGTSSASSKLVHGGLRYLEHYEFRLVREALGEREVLLRAAPHLVEPLRIVLPLVPGRRSWALLRLGLLLYDHLGRRQTIPGSKAIQLGSDPSGRPLRAGFTSAFAYWDCWADDARLVVANAQQAAARGAAVLTRTRVAALAPDVAAGGAVWRVALAGEVRGREILARVVVNAGGPWVASVRALAHPFLSGPAPALRLVRGSHIVVPRYLGAEDGYLLQRGDGRIVFALPFADRFTMIGTTDVPVRGELGDVRPDDAEEDYLVEAANDLFQLRIGRRDVVWRFAGVRPLVDDAAVDPAAVTRDWRLHLEHAPKGAPMLTVVGGKITTYRRLAEAAVERLRPFFPKLPPPWTAMAPLPGGDIAALGFASFTAFRADLVRRRPGFEPALLSALARRHGTRTDTLLADARDAGDLGPVVAGVSQREVEYMLRTEWARTPEDILWRRTKAGLLVTEKDRAAAADVLSKWLSSAAPAR